MVKAMESSRKSRHPNSRLERDPDDESDIEEKDRINLADIFKAPLKGNMSVLDSNWFSDIPRLSRLKMQKENRSKPGSNFLAFSAIETWAPLWLGNVLPAPARKTMLKARESLTTLNTAQVLTQSITFWFAHVAIGSVPLQAMLAHLCLLVRFCDERGASWTRQYSKHLTLAIHAKIREGETFDMGTLISREDLDITRLVSLEVDKAPASSKARLAAHSPTVASTAGTITTSTAASATATRPPKAAKASGKGKPQADGPGLGKPGYICFSSDPANGLSCSDKTCQKEHLDTRIPDQASRFVKAKAAFERSRRSDTSKAGGKGQ